MFIKVVLPQPFGPTMAIASPVNVSVYPFAGKLLAFGEQGLPWELDAETLETVGEHTFERRLNPISPFSAHPHFDDETGEMFNFGVSFASARPTLTLYKFNAEGKLEWRKRLPLHEPCSMHDFGLSARYAIFYLAPYLLDVSALMQEGATIQDSLRWQPERGSRLLVVERESGEEVANVAIGNRYCLHQINCFEEGDKLVVDVLELDEPVYGDYQPLPDLFVDVAPARPARFVVDIPEQRLVSHEEIDFQPASEVNWASDFPAIDPSLSGKDYRHFWMLSISKTGQTGRKFFDRLVHVDWQARAVADHYASPDGKLLGGEPVFVPEPNRNDRGVILSQEFDAENGTGAFLVFDAFDLASGPIARIPLPYPLHLGFHACWHEAE